MSHYYAGFHDSLVGRRLKAVSMDGDRQRLTIEFEDGGSHVYRAEGDCCSSTWIEHITVPDGAIGSEIVPKADRTDGFGASPIEVDDSTDKVDEEAGFYGECIQVYQDSFATTGGEVIVEYRNSSNGYYGGTIELVEVDGRPFDKWAD